MTMLLSVFLAFCLSSFATSRQINEIQTAVSSEPDFGDNSCGCSKEPVSQCGCCDEFEFDGKEHKICMNMTYEKQEKGIRFTVIFDGKVLFNETVQGKHQQLICEGNCPLSCICVNYYNMSYGDDKKWGGCLEIYGDVVIQILDVKFGCFYLPVNQQQKIEKPIHTRQSNHMGSSNDIFNQIQQWFHKKFGK